MSTEQARGERRPVRLDGQVAIVTGAGNGLGKAYALELASRGASVVCNDVDAHTADATAREIGGAGGSALAEASSVATEAGGAAIVAAALEGFGRVDVVVNNAGQLRNAAFEDLSVDDFESVVQTHLLGAFYVTQPAYRRMQAAGYGRIVFTSSSAGLFGSAGQANYAAAKTALVGLCRVVAIEGERHGILANAVMPRALTGIGERGRPPLPAEELRETREALTPLIPYLTTDRVAGFVAYLASRNCEQTGKIFSVGNGHFAQAVLGVTRGWYAPGLVAPEAEDVAGQIERVCDRTELEFPSSMNDEVRSIVRHLP